jgi:GNAT superfamily N-acetyltransferase
MVNNDALQSAGYRIGTDIGETDIHTIHQYLSVESYWAKNIPLELVKKSIDNSLAFAVHKDNDLVGFARVVTDKATFAYLADVFILEQHRGKGLSKWMLQNIHAHPDLQGLRRWLLGTKDAHELYKQFGWEVLPEAIVSRFMQLHNPDVYMLNA